MRGDDRAGRPYLACEGSSFGPAGSTVEFGMNNQPANRGVERMFPFVLRSRTLVAGRHLLQRLKRKLHFVLVTTDISEHSRDAVLEDFAHCPVVQHYSSDDLERFFGLKNARVVGFKKSTLAQSIYGELKQYRIGAPRTKPSTKIVAATRKPGR